MSFPVAGDTAQIVGFIGPATGAKMYAAEVNSMANGKTDSHLQRWPAKPLTAI